MIDKDELWAMEERFWTEGADSSRHMTAKDAVFIFPYPVGILKGDRLWSEKEVTQSWRTVVMSDRNISRNGNIAVLAYHISAERSSEPIYEALCTSTYLKDDRNWVRMAHQRTPVG